MSKVVTESTSSIRRRHSLQDDITSVVIENGVTNIGNYAFYNCGNLTSVTIGSDVKTIGLHAF